MFFTLLQIAGTLPLALGIFVLYHVFRPQHKGVDRSNRINKIRLLWFALTREELFADTFPWLRRDELSNTGDSHGPQA